MSSSNRPKIFFLRNLLVNRSCQLQLLAYNVLTIVVTGGFFMLLTLSLQGGESLETHYYLNLLLGFGVFLFLFFVGLWVSNKIVGPIYRLEKHMEALLRGEEVQELKFRAGDQFRRTAEIYNELIKHIESRRK